VDSTRASLPRPPPPDQPLPRRSGPVDDRAPVPDDLIAEIEAFKDLVRKRDPEATRQARTGPPRLPDPPGLGLPPIKQVSERPPRPNLDLLNRLPPFSMTVHVYDPNPSRRFIYINGRKLTESQQTPDGIRLERVVDDGAVLSWQGEEFFQRR
jgi:general secretion pathway protein B